jgi:hypothetical protein
MESPKNREVASDMAYALFLIKHIEEPCEDAHGNNIRDFYIREAKKVLPTFTNSDAKKVLQDAIDMHSK